MKITVCLGSACHVKGSHQVLESIQRLIKTHHVEDQIELAGTFCTGNCDKGVCVTVDGNLISFSPNNVEELFGKEILAKLQ